MTINEWQERLEKTFLNDEFSADLLTNINTYEEVSRNTISNRFHGTRALTNSFLTFFVETLYTSQYQFSADKNYGNLSYFRMLLTDLTTMIHRLRSSEILFNHGYPLFGYSLLRDIRDQSFFIAGVINEKTTFNRLMGRFNEFSANTNLNELSISERKKMLNYKKNEENKVIKETLQLSGAPDNILNAINKWHDLFHKEVHGSTLTNTTFMPFLTGEKDYQFFLNITDDEKC